MHPGVPQKRKTGPRKMNSKVVVVVVGPFLKETRTMTKTPLRKICYTYGHGHLNMFLHRIRADLREGDEDSNLQFSESGGSVNGPNLFTELPFL